MDGLPDKGTSFPRIKEILSHYLSSAIKTLWLSFLYFARFNFVQNKKCTSVAVFVFLLTPNATLFYLYAFFCAMDAFLRR